jgi:hypothetical protein
MDEDRKISPPQTTNAHRLDVVTIAQIHVLSLVCLVPVLTNVTFPRAAYGHRRGSSLAEGNPLGS